MKLLQDERFLNIIEYLKEHQTATLAELAEYNGVSVDTTRRDIEKLDKDKMVKKVRGGATYHQADITTQRTSVREILNENCCGFEGLYKRRTGDCYKQWNDLCSCSAVSGRTLLPADYIDQQSGSHENCFGK